MTTILLKHTSSKDNILSSLFKFFENSVKHLKMVSFNRFQSSFAFHIETSHFIYTANQMTGGSQKGMEQLTEIS